ncbi:MAG: hypothetical protein JWP66_933 [Naasia sp.]|nr:hypothetical protein [Naasia sp.]
MKKLITGAIAGTVGIALLVGGAGTFALWSSQAQVDSTIINSGHLTLTASGTGTWKESGAAAALPTDYKIIPGKTVVFTQDLVIDAVGNDLTAELKYTPIVENGGLASFVDTTVTVVENSTDIDSAVLNGNTVLDIKKPGTYTVTATVTAYFRSNVTGQDGANSMLNPDAMTFTLAQK